MKMKKILILLAFCSVGSFAANLIVPDVACAQFRRTLKDWTDLEDDWQAKDGTVFYVEFNGQTLSWKWVASDTTAENKIPGVAPGTVVASTQREVNGRWILQHSGPVNFRWWGAGNSDATADTAAFLAAAATNAKAFYMPKGTYRINSTIEFGPNVKITGDGMTQSVIDPQMTDGTPVITCGPYSSLDGFGINTGIASIGPTTNPVSDGVGDAPGEDGYCIGLKMGTYDIAPPEDDATTRSSMKDILITGCYVGLESNGWQAEYSCRINRCHIGVRLSQQNNGTISLDLESCAQYMEVEDCLGVTFERITMQGSSNAGLLPTAATSTFDSSTGLTIENLYLEEKEKTPGDGKRAHPIVTFGSGGQIDGLTLHIGHATGDLVQHGTPAILLSDVHEGEISGYISGPSNTSSSVEIGANCYGIDASRVLHLDTTGGRVQFESGAELPSIKRAYNPLPRFEHRGGMFDLTSVTRANASWVESSAYPGTWALRIASDQTSTGTAYARLELNDKEWLGQLDGKRVTIAVVARIPDDATFLSPGDDPDSSPIRPQMIAKLLDASEATVGGDITTSQSLHARNTIQVYTAERNFAGETGIRGVRFDLYLGGFGETNDWTAHGITETVTFTNATNRVNSTATQYRDGDMLQFSVAGGSLPAELALSTPYYVVGKTADDFQLSLSPGGTPVTFSDDGTATVNAKTSPYIDIEAIYLMVGESAQVNTGAILAGQVDALDITSATMVNGRLVTSIDARSDTSHLAEYEVGDKIVADTKEEICATAGSTTTAVFVPSNNRKQGHDDLGDVDGTVTITLDDDNFDNKLYTPTGNADYTPSATTPGEYNVAIDNTNNSDISFTAANSGDFTFPITSNYIVVTYYFDGTNWTIQSLVDH